MLRSLKRCGLSRAAGQARTKSPADDLRPKNDPRRGRALRLAIPRQAGRASGIAACTLCLATSLAGCSGAMLSRPYTADTPRPPEWIGANRITVTCKPLPSGAGPAFVGTGAVASAGAALFADFLVKLGSNYLKDLQARRNAVWVATGLTSACVPTSAGAAKHDADILIERVALDRNGDRIGQPGFALKGDLSFTPLPPSTKDGPAQLRVEFHPVSLIYGRAAPTTRGSGRKRVVLLVKFSENAVLDQKQPTADVKIDAPLRIDLGTLPDGSVLSEKMLKHMATATVMPMPKSSKIVATAIVFETEDELLALKAFTEAFDANADSFREVLKP